jgi:hypothetical protein
MENSSQFWSVVCTYRTFILLSEAFAIFSFQQNLKTKRHSNVIGSSLWSSGHSSWLQISRTGFDSRRYHIFWEVVGLERGPLSLVGKTEELLERKSSGSGLEDREYGRRDPPSWLRGTLYPQKLALTSPKFEFDWSIQFARWLRSRSLVLLMFQN